MAQAELYIQLLHSQVFGPVNPTSCRKSPSCCTMPPAAPLEHRWKSRLSTLQHIIYPSGNWRCRCVCFDWSFYSDLCVCFWLEFLLGSLCLLWLEFLLGSLCLLLAGVSNFYSDLCVCFWLEFPISTRISVSPLAEVSTRIWSQPLHEKSGDYDPRDASTVMRSGLRIYSCRDVTDGNLPEGWREKKEQVVFKIIFSPTF